MQEKQQYRWMGYLLAILGGVFSSIAPALVKIGVTSNVEPITLLVYRFIISVVFFWIFSPIFIRKYLRISWRTLGSCALVALSNTISLYAFYLGVSRINASLVMMIFSFYPLAAVIYLSLRGEKTSPKYGLILMIGILGVYLLLGAAGTMDWLGVFLAMLIPIFYALHLVLIQWTLSDIAPQSVALYTITIMGVFITAVALPLDLVHGDINPTGWLVIIITAVVSTVLARLSTFAGISLIGSGTVALLGPLEILAGILWALLLLGERLTLIQWIGGTVIFLSATLVLILRYRGDSS